MKAKETWGLIPGFPGYEASYLGRIRNASGRILKPSTHSRGYVQYGLQCKGKTRTVLGHRLIASAFIGNPDRLPCVNHLNGDKSDNRVSNLEWVTHAGNSAHAKAAGKYQEGLDHHHAKLTDDEVIEMHRLKKAGRSTGFIAKAFGIQKGSARRILNGKERKRIFAMLAAAPLQSSGTGKEG